MEDQLVQLLANIQLSEQAPRQQAEIDIKRAESNPAFPISLVNIAAHTSVDTGIRQSALSTLRLFIQKNWSAEELEENEAQIPISDEARARLKRALLELALSSDSDRKIKIAASYAVGKVAIHDFPEQWPDLLPTVLGVIPTGNDAQLHGALRVLGDLVEESLSEDQFFSMATDIAKALTHVALDENRKPMLRALAISIFRGCFDLMNMVRDDAREVRTFAAQLMTEWNPFFIAVLKGRLPDAESANGSQPESWNSVIALKLQVVKTLLRIRRVFPNLLLPQSATLFTAVWEDLCVMRAPYEQLYIKDEAQARLEDSDNLPYTLDLLILEEIDFLNQCFRAPPVQAELDEQLRAHAHGHEVPWMLEIMSMLVTYSQVTKESQDIWDFDSSLYLAEEGSVTAQYTARTAAGDLLIKMGEWFDRKTVEGLFGYTKSLFTGQGATWRPQEAALYLFVMLVGDMDDVVDGLDKSISGPVASAYLELVDFAINRSDEPLLRARGYLVAGVLGSSLQSSPMLLDRMIFSIGSEESELVQVACIKAVEDLIRSGNVEAARQVQIIDAIHNFLQGKDHDELEDADELVVTLTEALRAAISLDYNIVHSSTSPATDILFLLVKVGASNFQTTSIISELFEDIVVKLCDSFGTTCAKVLPTLTATLDAANLAENNPLTTVAVELLSLLLENGSSPLPDGLVAAVLPKLNRFLMESNEGEVLRPGSEAVKWLLQHDAEQVFNWHDENGRSGLEVCLHIVDRLLAPSVEDNSASEVGGLAAELVEKAGQERLGPFLPQLLQAVANRLATAQAAAFIQSLILVFARLSLNGAHDVVEFLSQIQINGESGLQVVLTKWLENSVSFAGYDEIRQNLIALSKLFSLNDPRIAQILVKGDLIIANDGMIKTRSRAKKSTSEDAVTSYMPTHSAVLDRLYQEYRRKDTRTNPATTSLDPDQYTIIPATLKILKVMIEELSGNGSALAGMMGSDLGDVEEEEEEDKEEGWEDDDSTLDLGMGATKAALMAYGLEGPGQRPRDDEIQGFLTEFFMRCARENVASFQDWYGMLTEGEKAKLNEVANAASG